MSSYNKGVGFVERKPIVATGVVAVLFFVAMEIMFFGGLISAYLVNLFDTSIKGSPYWPPPGQWTARLPIGDTAVNTLILFISAVTVHLSVKAIQNPERIKQAKKLLIITFILGFIFVAIQGYEWINLISYGLTVATYSVDWNFGGFFYLLIGAHALHVVVGLLIMIIILMRLMKGRYSSESYVGFSVGRIYWFFVVGLWPILYFLVYLMKKNPQGVYFYYFSH